MSSWKNVKLRDALMSANTGLDAIKRAPIVNHNTGVKCLRIQDISQKKMFLEWGFTEVSENNYRKFQLKKEDIIIARTGATVGVNMFIKEDLGAVFNNGLIRIRTKNDLCSKYIYYLLRSKKYWEHINGIAHGTTSQPNIQINQLLDFNVPIPDHSIQKAIAETLSSLDDKIELNNKVNQELESLAQALFKHWFVDFEFPNDNGQPYKSSGGDMVESEMGEIPKGWQVKTLNEISDCFDSKRVPLSSMEREKRKGIFPYYGAASLMDYVDDYLFEGVYVLMGEDGSVVDDSGFPVLQYVFGKFWVNNHSHVLKGTVVSTELILCLLRKTNISHLVTGAVQPKLNQGNMNRISMPLPEDLTILNLLEDNMSSSFAIIRNNISENIELAQLRDLILPKLLSGELQLLPDKILKMV